MVETLDSLNLAQPDGIAGVVDVAPGPVADEALVVADAAAEPVDPQAALAASPDGGVPVAADRPREVDTVADKPASATAPSTGSLPALNVHADSRAITPRTDADNEVTKQASDGAVATQPAETHTPDGSRQSSATDGKSQTGSTEHRPIPAVVWKSADLPGAAGDEDPEEEHDSPPAGGDGGNNRPTDYQPSDEGDPEDNRRVLARAAIREAQEVKLLPDDWERGRAKLRGDFTIDPRGTADHDDTVGYKGHVRGGEALRVSIADVSSLQRTPRVIENARDLGETRYGARSTEPMIPREISHGTLSIRHDQSTPVLARQFIIDPDHPTAAMRIDKPFFGDQRPYRLSYDKADRILGSDEDDLRSTRLRALLRIAQALTARRVTDSEIAVYRPDIGFMTNAQGDLVALPDEDHPAEQIVREAMILWNTSLAESAHEHAIPFLFRNHHILGKVSLHEELEILRHGSEDEQRLALGRLQRDFGRAVLGTRPTGHEGLGVSLYARSSSPLRLFEGLVNISNYTAWMRGEPYPFPADGLPAIADHLNAVQGVLFEQRLAAIEDVRQRATWFITRVLGGDSDPRLEAFGVPREIAPGPREPDTDFLQAVARRLEAGMGVADFGRLLHNIPHNDLNARGEGWDDLAGMLLRYLEENPNELPAIINYLSQKKLATIDITVDETHLDRAEGDYSGADGTVVHVTVEGAASRGEARRIAMLALLTAVYSTGEEDVRVTLESTGVEASVASAIIPEATEPPIAGAISQLYEMATARGASLAAPTIRPLALGGPFEATFTGPNGEILGVGVGTTHAAAKLAAASDALRQPDTLTAAFPVAPEAPPQPFGSSPRNRLQELYAQAGSALPSYATSPAPEGGFVSIVTDPNRTQSDGSPFILGKGRGQRVKLAEAAAAQDALDNSSDLPAGSTVTASAPVGIETAPSTPSTPPSARNALQERLVAGGYGMPTFDVNTSPDGGFIAIAYSADGTILGEGSGANKKIATTMAAQDALDHPKRLGAAPEPVAAVGQAPAEHPKTALNLHMGQLGQQPQYVQQGLTGKGEIQVAVTDGAGTVLAIGTGLSKKSAEFAAAEAALVAIRQEQPVEPLSWREAEDPLAALNLWSQRPGGVARVAFSPATPTRGGGVRCTLQVGPRTFKGSGRTEEEAQRDAATQAMAIIRVGQQPKEPHD